MAKDPNERFESNKALVEALRGALAEPEHTTRLAPPPPPPAPLPVRRSRHPWRIPAIVGLLAAMAIVGALLAAALAGGDDNGSSSTPSVVTQVTTQEGERVTVTETTEPPPPPPPPPPPATSTPPPPPPPPAAGGSGRQLTDSSTGLIRQGRYAEALPIAQQALAKLKGSGELYEAYANYNVGRSLIELGRCEEGLPYIAASEAIQGSRAEFRAARAKCSSG